MTRRRRHTLALACAVVALAGCQSMRREKPAPPMPPSAPPPAVVVPKPPPPPPPAQPAPRSCVPRSVGGAPRYPDTDAALRAAPGAADRYQLMAAGRIVRQQRLEELERVLAGCREAR